MNSQCSCEVTGFSVSFEVSTVLVSLICVLKYMGRKGSTESRKEHWWFCYFQTLVVVIRKCIKLIFFTWMRDNANKNDRKFKSTITEFFKDYFLINYEYVCLSVGMCIHRCSTPRSQRRASDSLTLEVRTIVSHLIWK